MHACCRNEMHKMPPSVFPSDFPLSPVGIVSLFKERLRGDGRCDAPNAAVIREAMSVVKA